MAVRWIVALLLATGLAGCSDAPAPADDPEAHELDLEATSTTGVIRGVVLDETITPIQNARIRTGSGQETSSNENGLFGFQALEPGIHFLTVSKPGFHDVQQSAEVVAGVASPALVKIQLVRAPGTEPFAVYLAYDGYIGCAFKAANQVFPNQCAAIGNPDRDQVLDFGTPIVPELLQTEIVWSSTQEFGRMLGTIQYVVDEADELHRVGNVWGPSPLVCTVTPEDVCSNGDGTGGGGDGFNETGFAGRYYASVYAACYMQCVPGTAVGAGIILEQSYGLYASGFFNTRPPEGWTLQADGEYQPPT